MAEYQKYMFDNFVISSKKEEEKIPAADLKPAETLADEEIINEIPDENLPADDKEEVITDAVAIADEPTAEEPEFKPEISVVREPAYSQEELDEAVQKAEQEAYNKGVNAAKETELQKQVVLLEEIRNQLMALFAGLDEKTTAMEAGALKFAVEVLRKALPTLERERAEVEVKNFLANNFANFAAQEALSFAFNPETIPLVADSIGRLAEQNDFEGKIAVHKDEFLGPADCRVEWKSGGVEHSAAKILDKAERLIDNNIQERENG